MNACQEAIAVQGTVKWFNNSKGYGFIGRDDGPDVFVHYSAITGDGYRTLQEDDPVEFEIVQGPKGAQVSNVQKAGVEQFALIRPEGSAPLLAIFICWSLAVAQERAASVPRLRSG